MAKRCVSRKVALDNNGRLKPGYHWQKKTGCPVKATGTKRRCRYGFKKGTRVCRKRPVSGAAKKMANLSPRQRKARARRAAAARSSS